MSEKLHYTVRMLFCTEIYFEIDPILSENENFDKLTNELRRVPLHNKIKNRYKIIISDTIILISFILGIIFFIINSDFILFDAIALSIGVFIISYWILQILSFFLIIPFNFILPRITENKIKIDFSNFFNDSKIIYQIQIEKVKAILQFENKLLAEFESEYRKYKLNQDQLYNNNLISEKKKSEFTENKIVLEKEIEKQEIVIEYVSNWLEKLILTRKFDNSVTQVGKIIQERNDNKNQGRTAEYINDEQQFYIEAMDEINQYEQIYNKLKIEEASNEKNILIDELKEILKIGKSR